MVYILLHAVTWISDPAGAVGGTIQLADHSTAVGLVLVWVYRFYIGSCGLPFSRKTETHEEPYSKTAV